MTDSKASRPGRGQVLATYTSKNMSSKADEVQSEEYKNGIGHLTTFKNYDELAADLFARVETGVLDMAELIIESGVALSVLDIAEHVERSLPTWYPAPKDGGRLEFIAKIVGDIISGKAYAE